MGVTEFHGGYVGLSHGHDTPETLYLVRGCEADGGALSLHAGGSAYPVEVGGGVLRDVVVYNVGDIVDI